MAQKSNIEWTETTWNPITGCTRCSAGCDHCYAALLTYRLERMGQAKYAGLTLLNSHGRRHFNGRVRLHEDVIHQPLRWRKPRTVFVNSMSDLFHRDVPLDFILRIFEVMNTASHHQYQILTKRSQRLAELSGRLPWSSNIWMGVSVENADNAWRIDDLRLTGAAVKFLSLEPLLGPLPNLDLESIGWVIVGGESGPKARPMDQTWVIEIRDQCGEAGVPFFFKQWGGVNKKKAGRLLEGQTWNEMPLVA